MVPQVYHFEKTDLREKTQTDPSIHMCMRKKTLKFPDRDKGCTYAHHLSPPAKMKMTFAKSASWLLISKSTDRSAFYREVARKIRQWEDRSCPKSWSCVVSVVWRGARRSGELDRLKAANDGQAIDSMHAGPGRRQSGRNNAHGTHLTKRHARIFYRARAPYLDRPKESARSRDVALAIAASTNGVPDWRHGKTELEGKGEKGRFYLARIERRSRRGSISI